MKKEGRFVVAAGAGSITLPASFFPSTPSEAHAYFGDVSYPACSDFPVSGLPACGGGFVTCSGIPGDTDSVTTEVSGGNVTFSWNVARQRVIAYNAQ